MKGHRTTNIVVLNFRGKLHPVYYVSGHHFIFTINENGMRHLVEVDKGKSKSLRESDVFQTARKESGYRRGVLAYINVPAALSLAEKNIPATASRYWSGMLKLTGIQAVRGFVYTTRVEGDGFEESGFVEVNRERSGFIKIYMEHLHARWKVFSTSRLSKDGFCRHAS